MDDDAGGEPVPITPEMLADLQAGLLDDDTAAALRRRVRGDPDAAAVLAALDRVRGDLAQLGTDEPSAPEVPAAVTARIGAALRTQRDTPAHSARHTPRWQLIALVVGVGAALTGVGLGGLMLTRDPAAPTWSTGATAKRITVSRTVTDLPLAGAQLAGLLARSPDYGPLADPKRRADCLSGLGYPGATSVLGARQVDMHGQPGVLLLLPADPPGTVRALVVEPDCNAAHAGVLANTLVTRP
ncbi:MAG TPA: hypothetical protein VFK56_07785 [Mycobacterium sp.]|nr:hypothetical protein [Mycobacterium sp.]